MNIKVTKAHGTGNDFVIIYDNNNHDKIKSPDFIQEICNRKKGIGANGLILLSDHDHYDYRMDYFNNDGGWETLCANGSRCAALLMQKNNLCSNNIRFITGDGEHKIKIVNKNSIALSMAKPHFKTDEITVSDFNGKFVDSGAKHFATIIDTISYNDVKKYGSEIRCDAQFSPDGVNVNFMKIITPNHIKVCTYEKGIENMVQSCGSGSVASAFYASSLNKIKSPLKISVPGGELKLIFSDSWEEIWLTGPARLSFDTAWKL